MLASPTPTPDTEVDPPTPLAAGVAQNCTGYHQVASYDTCENILIRYMIDIDQFYSMSPSINSDCTGLAVGTWYCMSIWPRGGPPPDDDEDDDDDGDSTVTDTTSTTTPTATETYASTPSPIQTGMVSDCSNFYKVQSGDGCWAIANDKSISLDNFYAWNPAVQTDCSELQADVYVCIGVKASQVTSTLSHTISTSSSGGVTTPTPTQDGMVSGCKKFYKVQSGDGCWAIANYNSINLDDFYTWNPAVKTDCSGPQANVYVCIGV